MLFFVFLWLFFLYFSEYNKHIILIYTRAFAHTKTQIHIHAQIYLSIYLSEKDRNKKKVFIRNYKKKKYYFLKVEDDWLFKKIMKGLSLSLSLYIYIYIVIHRQTDSLYHNSSVWLDTQDASSWDQNHLNLR